MPSATRTVTAPILDILNRSTITDNRLVLPADLPRPDYVAVNRVLEKIGGKWNRSARAHLFAGDADAALEPVLLTGKVTDERRLFDAFYTPPAVADRVIDLAKIGLGMRVLEPSCGMGALASRAAAAGAYVVASDVRDTGWSHPDVVTYFGEDFLEGRPGPGDLFDRVVMNPPFSNQADMAHVRHAASFIKDGGRLVAVMSPSYMFRTTRVAAAFRDWLDEHPHDVEALPDNSFKVSGTGVRTVILAVDL